MKLGDKYCLEWSEHDCAYYVVIDGIREDAKECKFEESYEVSKQLSKDYLFKFDKDELNNIKEESIYIFPLYVVDHPRYLTLCKNIVDSHKLAEIRVIEIIILGNKSFWERQKCVKLVFAPQKTNTVDLYSFRENIARKVEYADILENYTINPDQYPFIREKYNNSNLVDNYINNILTLEFFSYQTFSSSNPILYFIIDENGYVIPAEKNKEYINTHQMLWYLYWHFDITPFCHEYIANLINRHHAQIIYGTPRNIQGDLIRYQRILHITTHLDLSEDAQHEFFDTQLIANGKLSPEERTSQHCVTRDTLNKILSDIPLYEISHKMKCYGTNGSEDKDLENEMNKFYAKFEYDSLCKLFSELHRVFQSGNTSERCTWLYNISYHDLSCLRDAVFFILSSDCFVNPVTLEKPEWHIRTQSNKTLSGLPIWDNQNNAADLLTDIRKIKEKLSKCELNISNGISSLIGAFLNRHFIQHMEEIITTRNAEEMKKKDIEIAKAKEEKDRAEERSRTQEAMSESLAHEINGNLSKAYQSLESGLNTIDIVETTQIRKIMRFIQPISARVELIRLAYGDTEKLMNYILEDDVVEVSLYKFIIMALRESLEDIMYDLKSNARRNFIKTGCAKEAVQNSKEDTDGIQFTVTYFDFKIICNETTINIYSGHRDILGLLLHEYLKNAIKYCSFLPREQRFINVQCNCSTTKIHFIIQNSFTPEQMGNTYFSNHGMELNKRLISKIGEVKIETLDNVFTVDFVIDLTNNK